MARYFFETKVQNQFISDDEGCELANDEAARAAALFALPGIAGDMMPSENWNVLTMRVLNGDRVLIYQSTVTFEGGWTASTKKSALIRALK